MLGCFIAYWIVHLSNITTIYSTNHVKSSLWQMNFVFGKCIFTCVRKHSNAFRTSLNWHKNFKCVWHEPKIHVWLLPRFGIVICERLMGFQNRWSNPWNRACLPRWFITWLSDNVRYNGHKTRLKRTSRLHLKHKLKSVWKSNAFKNAKRRVRFERKRKIANTKIYEDKVICTVWDHEVN